MSLRKISEKDTMKRKKADINFFLRCHLHKGEDPICLSMKHGHTQDVDNTRHGTT